MTQPPNYAIKTYGTSVHTGMPANAQPPGLDAEKQRQFNQWTQNVATKTDLVGGNVPVAGAGVTSVAPAGMTPATSVAVDTTNMLVSQNFTNPDTVASFKHWSWDGDDGNLTLGCARVDCDGTQDDLISNEIPVVAGETIEVVCQTKCEDIVYTGSAPIVLGVQKYRKGLDSATNGVTYLDVGGVDVVALQSPAADVNWGDGDLAGNYVVEAGVDQLRFRFGAPGVTSGTVKWDEAVFLKLDLIDDAAVPGVGVTVDDIVRQLFGSDGDSFTHNDSAVALGNAADSIKSLNARVSAMEAEFGTGAVAGDEFSWTGEITANSDWSGTYAAESFNGFYTANGGDAVWTPATFSPFDTTQTALYAWNGVDSVSDTDYQLVQLLLSSASATNHGYKSYVYLLGRISTGFGSYVRAAFGSDGTYVVDHWNGSAFTVMDSGTCAVPGGGALLSLYCGDKTATAPRRFKLKVNTSTITEFDEVGTASPLGASNRKWGWGGKAAGGLYFALITFLPAQGKPAKINQWIGYDQ